LATPENSFKKYLLRIMKGVWDVQSHEDRYSPGIPDLSYGIDGINGWIELKYIGPRSRKPSKFTPQQINWLKKRMRYGGNCWVMVKKAPQSFYLFRGDKARLVADGCDLEAECEASWGRSIIPEELAAVLARPIRYECE
jgi:hypothetical protein